MTAAFFGMFFCEFRGMLKVYYFPEIYQTPLSAFAGIALAAGGVGMVAPAVYDLYYRLLFRNKERRKRNGADTGFIL